MNENDVPNCVSNYFVTHLKQRHVVASVKKLLNEVKEKLLPAVTLKLDPLPALWAFCFGVENTRSTVWYER